MFRVVYGETMPAWEETFATTREAEAFAKKQRRCGDTIFSIKRVNPHEQGPHSIQGAIEMGLIK